MHEPDVFKVDEVRTQQDRPPSLEALDRVKALELWVAGVEAELEEIRKHIYDTSIKRKEAPPKRGKMPFLRVRGNGAGWAVWSPETGETYYYPSNIAEGIRYIDGFEEGWKARASSDAQAWRATKDPHPDAGHG